MGTGSSEELQEAAINAEQELVNQDPERWAMMSPEERKAAVTLSAVVFYRVFELSSQVHAEMLSAMTTMIGSNSTAPAPV